MAAQPDYNLATQEGMRWAVRSLLVHKKAVEDLNLPVAIYEMRELKDDVKSLRRALYTFAFSTVGAAIVFAFTVFALLGKH